MIKKSTLLYINLGQKNRLLLDLIASNFVIPNDKWPVKVNFCNLKANKSRKAYLGHYFTVSSLSKLSIWFNYFDTFHLQGRKYEQVLKLKECYELMLNKEHLNLGGLHKIQKLQNQLRTIDIIN